MGKTKKARKRVQAPHPYARKPTNDVEMGMDDDAEVENEIVKPTDRTRGQMLQRHKLEWKSLRKDLEGLKRERVKLSKKNTDEKGARKDMSRQLKTMLETMQQRQKGEVIAWDTAVEADKAEAARAEAGGMEEEV
eukprot:TRINITY_DN7865_c0_g1_i1.p1 TRINITY_DN7865_c0_g1~~TRINITY_DN7865_c0_g1_i1.p1  ORF type:complete len:135 (-),score=30.67 TRINITY_DN7865_c0_g1_i1:276-680(-)